jgi:hypothetical protein
VRFGHARSDATSSYFLGNFNGSITTVYDGPYTYNVDTCGGTYCPFDAVISFSQPYLYQHFPGGLVIDVSATAAPGSTRISWEFATGTPGCEFSYSTLGITTTSSGFSADASAQVELFAIDTLPPADSPVSPPATSESEFFLPLGSGPTSVTASNSRQLPFSPTGSGGRSVTVRCEAGNSAFAFLASD